MDIFEIVQKKDKIFIIDDIEDKKTKALLAEINSELNSILDKFDDAKKFVGNQLKGDYNHKIVMAKSLQKHYQNWNAIQVACSNLKKEETDTINKFMLYRNQLVSKLEYLLNDCKKLPVLSAYDIINGEFYLTRKGHEVIILGNHNTQIISKIIEELKTKLVVEGNYDSIEATNLTANYSKVEKNVKECNDEIKDAYYDKPYKKMDKMYSMVNIMKEHALNLVFFATYKEEMKNVGCSLKEIDLLEKDLLKKYVPLKRQLIKILKIEFADIWNIDVNEEEYSSESDEVDYEYSSENKDFDEEYKNENFEDKEVLESNQVSDDEFEKSEEKEEDEDWFNWKM